MHRLLKNSQHYFKTLSTSKQILFYIVLFYTCLFLLPKNFKYSFLLDNQFSAFIGSQQALALGLQFGETYINAYGPFAFIKGRLDTHFGLVPILLIDGFIIGLTCYFLYTAQQLVQHSKHILLVLLPTVFISVFYDIAYIFYLFFIFTLLLGITSREYIPWLIAGFLAWLVLLIQIQPGFIMLCFFYLGLFIHYSFRKALFLSGFHLLGLLLICVVFNVHLFKYVSIGLKLLCHHRRAFSQIDYTGGYENYVLFIAITALVFWILIGTYFLRFTKQLLKNKRSSFSLLTVLGSLCLLHIQTFTHITPFTTAYLFFYGLLLLMMYSLFLKPQQGREYLQKIICCLCFCSILFSTAIGFSPNPVTLPYQDLVFESPIIRELRRQQTLAEIPLDSLMIATLSQKTIDVFPNEIAYLHYTHLNYTPRPVNQERYSYLPELRHLNPHFYESGQAPDYVLFNLPTNITPIQYDESTFLSILQHYSIAKVLTPRSALLSRRSTPIASTTLTKNTALLSNQIPFQLTDDPSLVHVVAKLEYTWLGYLYQLLFQPPHITYTITSNAPQATKNQSQGKLTPIQLSNGILITPFSTANQLATFLQSTQTESESTLTLSFNGLFYKKDFEITSQKVILQ